MSVSFDAGEEFRLLTHDEIRAELKQIDFSRASAIRRRADDLADELRGDGQDLLHDAISRALKSRTCRAEFTVEQFLRGIMRSIRSTAERSRERGIENHIYMPPEDMAAFLGSNGQTSLDPYEALELERVRKLCSDMLDELAERSPDQAQLIDGIAVGLRGKALADHVGVPLGGLATIRRALKRHLQHRWLEVEYALATGNDLADS